MKDTYSTKICCVGLGPAGIGLVYTLSNSPLAEHMLCLEAGCAAESRHCHILMGEACNQENPCNMISGVGGCSALASGKLSEYPAGGGLTSILGSAEFTKQKLHEALDILKNYLPLRRYVTNANQSVVEENFRKLGFTYRYYPVHIFDHHDLVSAYNRILQYAESNGVRILLNTEVSTIQPVGNHFELICRQKNRKIKITAKYLILAVGRYGQRLLKSLNSRIHGMCREYHLDVGVRLEFPTEIYPDIDASHKDLKLLFDNARTFCVCKDGMIAPYRTDNCFFLEGYFNPYCKTEFTNLAIMIRLRFSEQHERVFNEIRNRMLKISKGKPVRQMLPDYLGINIESVFNACSISFWQWGDVNQCFPLYISKKVRASVYKFVTKLMPKTQWNKVSVFAPEIDYRLRFPINSDFSVFPGLYLVGDCTGRFRGILQAFCSGIVCAENIMKRESQ